MLGLRFAGDGFNPFINVLTRFEDHVQDAEPVFEAMADHVATMNQRQFDAQGSYYGGAWSPLSPKYAAWKAAKRPGRPILVFDGLLRESLTQRPFGVDEITSKSMTVGTGIDYARYHQDGTDTMPARELLGRPTREDTKMWAKMMHEFIVKGEVSV
ncbi:phage virion morphogenesis protein [Paeniglutamicibacter sp. R2-26]|uniref:phage virion morphogenesis protein n=1 Tax=Paeniglutamicibacter sp. R2-26 TaxID=3144417 RepID=UPI003EE4CA35